MCKASPTERIQNGRNICFTYFEIISKSIDASTNISSPVYIVILNVFEYCLEISLCLIVYIRDEVSKDFLLSRLLKTLQLLFKIQK